VRHLRAALTLALAVAILLGASAPATAQESGLVRLDLTIGKSQVINLKDPFNRVSVANPAIADAFVVTPTQILVHGKAVGTTSLVVFYPDRTMFFDLVISTDIGLLKERLKQVAPRDEIDVFPAGDGIVLSGSVSSSAVMAMAADLAQAFAPKGKVVNLLSLIDVKPQQVMIQVHVAEVDRAALKELGFSIRALGSTIAAGLFPGNPFALPLGSLGQVTQPGFSTSVVGRSTPDFAFDNSSFFLSSGSRDYAGVVRALSDRNMFRTLAKPNLVTLSGKEAKFLSGGEFPYPISQEDNTITVQFKEFGIGLIFTPVVVDGENISLKVLPEVSSLDFSQGLVSAGFRIPIIRKNQAFTNVSLKDGDSFAIAGLINNEVRQAVAKIPLLGDIPILGALFRSVRFQTNETELLFLVSVKLVKPSGPDTAATQDPKRLMELRPEEKKEFTMVPGFPGVGETMDRPFGESNLGPRR
jgi:pilus assembly protein CpaC